MSAAPEPYVVNVAEAPTVRHAIAGQWVKLERAEQPFEQVGVNIRILEPGDVSGLYHAEDAEEHFLVLAGRCLAIVGGVERELAPWDFLHVPAGVPHAIIGAGDGPSSVLMVGARHPGKRTHYPASELAARHRASSPVTTDSALEAYADWAEIGFEDVTPVWPPAG